MPVGGSSAGADNRCSRMSPISSAGFLRSMSVADVGVTKEMNKIFDLAGEAGLARAIVGRPITKACPVQHEKEG